MQAVAQAGDERHQRKAHHTRVDVAVQGKEGAAVAHLRQASHEEKDGDAGKADAQTGLGQGGIAGAGDDLDAQEGAQRQREGRTHAEQADAEAVMLVRDDVGHDGARGRADDAHADAHAQALDKEQREAGHPEEGGDAGRIEEQTAQQDDAAAEQGKQVAGGETAHEAADDHDPRRESRCAQAGPVGRAGITGAGHEHEVIGRHQQKVDEGDHCEIAAEDGAQGLPALLRPAAVGAGFRTALCGHVVSSGGLLQNVLLRVQRLRCLPSGVKLSSVI